MWRDTVRKEGGRPDPKDYDITHDEQGSFRGPDAEKFARDLKMYTGFHINPKGPTGDFGASNKSELVNWFTVVEREFIELLGDLALQDREGSGPYAGESDVGGTPNRKIIQEQGILYAGSIIQAAISAKITLDESKEGEKVGRDIDISDNKELVAVVNSVKQGIERLFTDIFDSQYRRALVAEDTDTDEELFEIDPYEVLDSGAIDMIVNPTWSRINKAVKSSLGNFSIERLNELLLSDEDYDPGTGQSKTEYVRELAEEVKTNILNASAEGERHLKSFSAHIMVAFIAKLNRFADQASPEDTSGESLEEERARLTGEANLPEVKYGEEYGGARREFEDEYKSVSKREHKWMDILSKESGVGLTSGANFSPAIHNKTYSCKECKEKKCRCM